jgi:outer membrane autotransporter protein
MNGYTNGRSNKTRITRTYKLAPTTRAIRAALAASMTVLALAGSSVALAGTCAVTATNTESCNGAFTNLPDGSFVPAVDLTLILGDSAPTSVTPAAGTVGVDASWGGNVGVISYADITTVGADGIHAYGSTSATLDNYGSITTNVTAAGANAVDISAYDDVTVVNGGDILAYSTGGFAVTAVTAYSSHGNVSLDNLDSGTITANSTGGNAVAVNASAHLGSVYVSNEGAISATAGNYVSATGINVVAGDYASVTNSGSIHVAAGNYGTATGIHAVGVNSATVINSGSIGAYGSTAYGINAYASDGLASVINAETGTITATAKGSATGIRAGGYHGTSYVYNAGDINVDAYGGKYTPTSAVGIKASEVNNTGNITVVSDGPLGNAQGIHAHSYGGNPVIVTNSGNISLSAAGFLSDLTGIYASNFVGGIEIVNSGDISAAATSYGSKYALPSYARGIAVDAVGDLYVLNSGHINSSVVVGTGMGIKVFGEGYTEIINSGFIDVTGSTALGIEASAGLNGSITVVNSGSITATGDSAFGIQTGFAHYTTGNLIVTNSGDIAVSSDFQAHGVNAYGPNGTGSVTFDNSGTIAVSTNVPANLDYIPNTIGGASYGVDTVNMYGDTGINNSGSITSHLYSYSTFANGLGRYQAGATGLLAYSFTGDIAINNSGSIAASSEVRSKYFGTHAIGIKVTNDHGDVALANSGAVSATALSDYRSYSGQTLATGMQVNDSRGITTISNSSTGSITANSTALLYGTAAAIGVDTYAITGDLHVANAGAIGATASSGATSFIGYYGETVSYGPTTATGVNLINVFGTTTSVVNYGSGAITANASADHYSAANAIGINASVYYGNVDVTNAGTITATANADGHSDIGDAATASGVLVSNSSAIYGATTSVANNAGGSITADASAYLSATAQGVAVTGATVDVYSAGTINATATADAEYGTAVATGLSASGNDVAVALGAGGHISASASGDYGTAIGLSVVGYNSVTASNAGSITAAFNGAYGNTYGAVISSGGDVTFTNSGHITATDADYAVGVELNSTAHTTLINSGTITANSTAAGSIAVLTGDSVDLIQNTGTINGALLTNGGNDTLTNSVGGVWNVIGASTDFGAGDDTINNAGTIHFNNSAITLGSHGALGNAFANSGLVKVSGDNNLLDMGSGNPNAFFNSGTVSFLDGAPDDTLTIAGDLAGNGNINVDVSGLHGTSDLLYVNGNVVAGSANKINVALLDEPTTASTTIPIAYATGNSTAGSFVLGNAANFNQNTSFVTLGFSLLSDIDASNATDDVFSLGINVTGLSDTGTLAASIAPGAQSLMGSEIGTWRQRMGVIDHDRKHGISLWARWFQDDGTVNAAHVASNFGNGGNFAFNQKNSGEEIGADYAFTDQFSAGLMLGNAQASQSLNGSGVGSTKFKGNTTGVYATWISPGGFYADASYRWMDFDAHLDSVAGQTRTSGKINAANLELGYAWTLDEGFTIEPQVQYTRTKVDHIDTLNGALTGFTPDGGTSSRLRAGLLASKAFTSGRAVWTPYVSVSAVREFDGKNAYSINGDFFGQTSTKGTSVLVEGGLAVQTGKLTIFGGLNWQDGGPLKSFTGGQLGVRYTW